MSFTGQRKNSLPLKYLTSKRKCLINSFFSLHLSTDQKLKSAVSKGVPTLVTNLERGVRGCLLNSLLTKNIAMSDDGTQSISYGKHRIDYHPNFRLYLCAAVSMDYNKKYRFSLPLHRTFVINLTTGKMGLEASLISYAARSEKPELENQRRSLDLDSYYLIKERKKLQVCITLGILAIYEN